MDEKEIDALINEIYGGVYTRRNIPAALYDEVIEALTDSIVDGFGFGFDEIDDVDEALASSFKSFHYNSGIFAASKTFHQMNEMYNALYEGVVKSTIEVFREKARAIHNIYNKIWLKTESETVFANSQMASLWHQFQEDKEDLPLLQYKTAADERVRHSHSLLHNIVRPVDDPFWDSHLPQNGWNCRCTVIQLERGDEPVTPKKVLSGLPQPDEGFNFNPGKSKTPFPKDHPYFSIPRRFKDLALRGFGMNIPPKP